MKEIEKTEQELMELHTDLSAINAKAPEMMDVLRGVIKGIRIASEAATEATRSPKASA